MWQFDMYILWNNYHSKVNTSIIHIITSVCVCVCVKESVWWKYLRYSLSNFQVHNTAVSRLCIRSSEPTNLITRSVLPISHIFPNSSASSNHLCFCINFVFCLNDSTCKWDHMVFVFFLSDYLVHKDNVLKVHPCCQKCRISSFIVIEKMHKYNVKYISYFLHSFIYQWTLMLLPYLGYCDRCNGCGSADISSIWRSPFLWMYIQKWDSWIIW